MMNCNMLTTHRHLRHTIFTQIFIILALPLTFTTVPLWPAFSRRYSHPDTINVSITIKTILATVPIKENWPLLTFSTRHAV